MGIALLRGEQLQKYAQAFLEYDGGMAEIWDNWMKRNNYNDYDLYLMTFWIILLFYIACCIPYVLLDTFKFKQTDDERLQPGTYNSSKIMWRGTLLVLGV